MSNSDEGSEERATAKIEVHTYGAVAYVSVTGDVAKAALKAGEEAKSKKAGATD